MARKRVAKSWLDSVKEWQSFIGTVVAIVLTIWVTSNLTAATKRTELFLEFTKQYRALITKIGAYNKDFRHRPPGQVSSEDKIDADQIYFELFSLLYDEFNAYQSGFLDKDLLVDWMTWQLHDFNKGKFAIGSVSYQEGWDSWRQSAAHELNATPYVERIYQCKPPERSCISSIVCESSHWQCHKNWLGM